jgi:phosphatidylinositol alpha-1,6-mannosyltransferase
MREEMTVLLFTPDFPPTVGGVARNWHELARHLHKIGAKVVVLTWSAGIAPGLEQQEEFTVIRIRRSRVAPLRWLRLILSLFVSLRKYKVNRIHAAIWFPWGTLSLLAFIMFRIPYFVSVNATEILVLRFSSPLNILLRRLMPLTLSRAKRIIAISQYAKERLIESGIKPEKIVILPGGGVDCAIFKPVDPSQVWDRFGLRDNKVILTVGRLSERKGQAMVIKALPQISRKVPNVVYLVVGEGEQSFRLKQLAKELGVADRVIFAGYVPDAELPAYYSAADVFIMPSRETKGDAEGFGIVYLEANACGKPVIGGRSGGIPDAICEGLTGLLVDPSNEEEIADAIIRVLQDEFLAEKLGANGRKRVEQELTWDRIATRLWELYQKV